MTDKPHIIVLTATLNDWESVSHLLPQLDRQLAKLNARGAVVVIDDGSTELKGKENIPTLDFRAIESVIRLTLYRNVGPQRALAAGLGYIADRMKADYVVVMDSDLEDDPDYIPALFESCLAAGGQKIVFAERTERSESWSFVILYRIYQLLHRAFVGVPIAVGSYSLLPWSLARRVAHVGELWHHFPAAIMRARLPFATVPTRRSVRLFGTSRMNLVALVVHAIGSFAVHAETVAVRAMMAAGIMMMAVALAVVAILIVKSTTELAIVGWTSQVLGILGIFFLQLFVAACIMVFIVVSLRAAPPNIPAMEYPKFIFEVETLYSGGAANSKK